MPISEILKTLFLLTVSTVADLGYFNMLLGYSNLQDNDITFRNLKIKDVEARDDDLKSRDRIS